MCKEENKKIERKNWIQCTTLTAVFLSLIQSEKCWGDGLKDKRRKVVRRRAFDVGSGDWTQQRNVVLMTHTLSCSHKQCKGKYTRGAHHLHTLTHPDFWS